MALSSHAKINLTLKVNYKNKKKLHEIQSYFCLIDLVDKIKIKKIKSFLFYLQRTKPFILLLYSHSLP